jgi:hypothetical protein
MERLPPPELADVTLQWIAHERDAAWTAKLAILGAPRREDIAHFGACLREHERHARELAVLALSTRPHLDIPTEPPFLTSDASVVASRHERDPLLDAIERIELSRVERYERRRRGADTRLETLLDAHLTDTRARLSALRRLRDVRREVAA